MSDLDAERAMGCKIERKYAGGIPYTVITYPERAMSGKVTYAWQSFEYKVLKEINGMQLCELLPTKPESLCRNFDDFFCEPQLARCTRIDRRKFIQRTPDPSIGVLKSGPYVPPTT